MIYKGKDIHVELVRYVAFELNEDGTVGEHIRDLDVDEDIAFYTVDCDEMMDIIQDK